MLNYLPALVVALVSIAAMVDLRRRYGKRRPSKRHQAKARAKLIENHAYHLAQSVIDGLDGDARYHARMLLHYLHLTGVTK